MSHTSPWSRVPPPSVIYAATAAFSLAPIALVVAIGDAPVLAWSVAATFSLATAWPIAQRLNKRVLEAKDERDELREQLASAADAALRAETLLRKNAERIGELGEQIRIAALNVRLHALESSDENRHLVGLADDLEALAHRATAIVRAGSIKRSAPKPPESDEGSKNLERLTEELHSIVATLQRDRREPLPLPRDTAV